MTITLDDELEQRVSENAGRLGVTPEEYVRRALAWYTEPEPELAVELAQWQAASRKAWAIVEESAP